ncbi:MULTISPECIES: oleate hydratase [Peptoniphilus]|uniref:oleate hydratase n=1 Tax=Peptoniphilus TaxID=162289 RepID=UPI00028A3990|nr:MULTISPECIES: oleate hydratase [Peptoniphilus]MDU1043346.1 oleate hydratase [Peptoniphilus rhinitidis]MDU3750297.1 oleate hydratase [Peptoniphilus rhinitidis]MDU5275703.1 oleate hydratase [Peptoniphilus lacydonensis]
MSKKDDIKKMALAAATISAAFFAAKKVSKDEEVKILLPNRDENTKAFLLGDGFGNLSLAFALINHANLDPSNINIYTKYFNEFTEIEDSENTYPTFDNRFSKFNFQNTLEMLKNILSKEELKEIYKKIEKKEKPVLLNLSGEIYPKLTKIDEESKKKIYKLLLHPIDFSKDEKKDKETIEKYFLFTDFLNTNLYYYLASLYNLKSTSPISEFKEALIDFIGSEYYFDLDTDKIYKKVKNYLKDLGVNFYENYKFVNFNAKENYVENLIFEKDNQVEDIYTDVKDIISIESPSYLDNLYIGNLKEFPKNILNTYFSKEIYNESKNIYREIEGRTFDKSIIYVRLDFSDASFVNNLKKDLKDKDFFIFKVKSGISVKVKDNHVFLKILDPNKNSIFVGDNFKSMSGDDFFFEIIKLFNLENYYGKLRFNLENVSISILEDYKKNPKEIYNKNINGISNLFFISSKSPEFGENYSVEKLVSQGIKNAHEIMGIDHLEVFEKNISKIEILKFINNL